MSHSISELGINSLVKHLKLSGELLLGPDSSKILYFLSLLLKPHYLKILTNPPFPLMSSLQVFQPIIRIEDKTAKLHLAPTCLVSWNWSSSYLHCSGELHLGPALQQSTSSLPASLKWYLKVRNAWVKSPNPESEIMKMCLPLICWEL